MHSSSDRAASDTPSLDGNDHVLRAITDDDHFRVMVAGTTSVVRGALSDQGVTGTTARHFADLLTGTVLIRETMSPHHRVQALFKGCGGKGSLVADAHPDGATRGLVKLPEGTGEFVIGAGSLLQMMRSLASGKVYKGVVQPPAGSSVPEALMTYLQESEQIVSVIATGMVQRDGEVVMAGGYVVQLLPDAKRGPLEAMTRHLESLPPFDEILLQTGGEPQRLLDTLLSGSPYAQLDRRPVGYRCQCNLEAVIATLATLSTQEIADLLGDDQSLELTCDYCHRSYRVGRSQLQGLLQSS